MGSPRPGELVPFGHSQGRDVGCRQQLIDLYAWFREGFETEDLRVVWAVLEEIG